MVEYKRKLNLNLKNKKVFISGSTRGIGYETARLFLEEGALVIINGRTKYSVDNALSKLNNKNASGIITNFLDRKSTRLNSSHSQRSRMPSSA